MCRSTVAPGEIRGLIGPNGAGKTTLINAITGAVAARGGPRAIRRAPDHGATRRTASATRRRPNVPARRAIQRDERDLENVLVGVARGISAWRSGARRWTCRARSARNATRSRSQPRRSTRSGCCRYRNEPRVGSAVRRAEADGPRACAGRAADAAADGRANVRHERVRGRRRDCDGARARRAARHHTAGGRAQHARDDGARRPHHRDAVGASSRRARPRKSSAIAR